MSRNIPPHVVKKWGSTRAFKAEKRRLVKEMIQKLGALEIGAAFLPNGTASVGRLSYDLRVLEAEVSVKNWGR